MESTDVQGTLAAIMELQGAVAVMLVDLYSGLVFAYAGGGFDLDIAAQRNTHLIKSIICMDERLGIPQKVDDILVTLNDEYHLIHLMKNDSYQTYIYAVFSKKTDNISLTKIKVENICNHLLFQ